MSADSASNNEPLPFVNPDPVVQHEIELRADEILADINETSPDDAGAEKGESEGWRLTVGQNPLEKQELRADAIPESEWLTALEDVDGEKQDGFVIVTAPDGSYIQTLAQSEGLVLELRQMRPQEKTPGFRHFRARWAGAAKSDEIDATACMMDLQTVIMTFREFTEDPEMLPSSLGLNWVDVLDEFTAVG